MDMRQDRGDGSRSRLRKVWAVLTVVVFFWAAIRAFSSKEPAEALISRHFSAVSAGDIALAMANYASEFFSEARSRESWAQTVSRIPGELGPVRRYELTGWSMRIDADGVFWEMDYDVQYTEKNTRETFL